MCDKQSCANCKHGMCCDVNNYICTKYIMTDKMLADRYCNYWEKEDFINKWRQDEMEREFKRYMKAYEPTIEDMYRYMDIPLTDKYVVKIVSEENKKEEKKMKLSEWIKKYGDCEVTEEMEKCIEKPKKKGKWLPKYRETYWYVNGMGYVTCDDWNCSHMDNYRRDFMRIFKTKAEAERYLEIMKACKEASFEPDWEDCNLCKYYFAWNYSGQKLGINYHFNVSFGEPFYFESEEIVRNLINKFGEKDIAKYVLGVEFDN